MTKYHMTHSLLSCTYTCYVQCVYIENKPQGKHSDEKKGGSEESIKLKPQELLDVSIYQSVN